MLKKINVISWVVFLCLGLQQNIFARQESTVPLKFDRQTVCRIIIPAKTFNPGMENQLEIIAEMLQRGFQETLGITTPIIKEIPSSEYKGISIYLGDTEELRKYGINASKFKDLDGVIATRGNNIFIAGYDRHNLQKAGRIGNYHHCTLGTLTGAIQFAEKYLNARFLYPGPYGQDFLPVQNLDIPGEMTEYYTRRIIFGSGRYTEQFYDYSTGIPGPAAFHVYGGHSYYVAVPAAKYAKTHPEYFVLNDGKRISFGNHLCISNPEVQELIYQNILQRLDRGYKVVEVGQTDGYRACSCRECLAYGIPGNDFGEKTWILHRHFAERLLHDRPGKMLLIICYPPNNLPPKSFNTFPKNVMIELCRHAEEDFQQWQKIKVPGGFVTYIYNWGNYKPTGLTPVRTPRYAADQARRFANNNVRGIYRCGFGEQFGLEGAVYYIYGKILENPELNEIELAREFYSRAFAESSIPMRTFFENLYRRVELHSLTRANDYPITMSNLLAAIYTPELMDLLRKNLERAEKLARQEKVKIRLKLVRAEFDYLKTIIDVIQIYQAYRTEPNWQLFDLLAKKIDMRNAHLDKIAPHGRAVPLKEFPNIRFLDCAPRKYLNENGSSWQLGAPFNWDTKTLRNKKVLPGTGNKNIIVRQAAGPVDFNEFESGVWKDIPWEKLNEVQFGRLKEHTRFKALYDKKSFYLAIESELDPRKKFQMMGEDGGCWVRDCLEIFLDTRGVRETYYQFIYNPIPQSCFDAAFGFITDPLHPQYKKLDSGWNGNWSYLTRREGGKWYSLFILKFDSSEIPAPLPGTIWSMNLSRQSRPVNSNGHEVPELSLWSPNLENKTGHSLEAMGTIQFQ